MLTKKNYVIHYQKEQVLKAKLGNRAQKSENDIESGRVFSRAEIEERTSNLGLK